MDDETAVLMATECAPTTEVSPLESGGSPTSSETESEHDLPESIEPSADDVPVAVDTDDEVSEPVDETPAGGNGDLRLLSECDEGAEPEADEITPEKILEALLFSSDAPLSAGKLADLIGSTTPGEVKKLVAALNERYEEIGLTFRIELIARGYQMMSLPRFMPWIAKLNKQRAETRLSDAALETLSIVAYKQPIIRADIEAIRGVSSGEVLNRLREVGMVRIVGRAEIVGRPMLYGTTRKFLDTFGLADLDDLPPMEALKFKPKPVTKSTDEVEPIRPPAIEEPPRQAQAAAGA